VWIPVGLVVSDTAAFWTGSLLWVATYRRAAYAAIGRGGEIGGEVVERRRSLGVRIHLNPVGALRLLCFHCEDGYVGVGRGQEEKRREREETVRVSLIKEKEMLECARVEWGLPIGVLALQVGSEH